MLKKLFVGITIALVSFVPVVFTAAQPVSAQVGVCTFIQPLCDALGIGGGNSGDAAVGLVARWFNLAVTVIFTAIILISVYVIVTNAVKYIQSQGDEGKIGEAQKAIKSVFIGIALMFVGLVGIVLVLAFFGGNNLLDFFGNQNLESCEIQCKNFTGDLYTKCFNSCTSAATK